MMVTASYLSLFMPPEQIPGRISLTITMMLTVVSMSNGAFENSPQTSYLKAIDVWLLACFTFTFIVLVEFAVVVYVMVALFSI